MSTIYRLRVLAVASLFTIASSLLVVTPAKAAPVAESSLSWKIESGDGGEPTTGVLTGPGVSFQSLRDRTISRINVTSDSAFWSISFAAPVDEELHPGIYPDAERAGFQTGRAPGLDVSVGSGGCNEVYGRFTIHQIAFDTEGTVTMLEASFVRRCSPGAPAVSGDLRYNAFPLSYRYTLSDQEPTTPASHTYRGATSTFFAQRFFTNSVRFDASGDRLRDTVEFSPPAGETLVVGRTYRDVQPVGQQDPGRAGLSVERFSCRPTTGTFTIKELVYGSDGEPVALSATFTLRCTVYPTPENPNELKGTIHFHA
ncbi:hypothetical protein [Phytohabitans houttuyneae]|uniref:Uncharacterized protein n=1 Tax=Phytohabitans houttuyneae TaxID=1076126 RepID=A0A6V8KCK8_9ACTN|nr:hypothetical protein [Phytohabitans houttuyneae]GFJ82953.1 hypothetical protein Phou_071330 [Phytohabitans houttuyneae]